MLNKTLTSSTKEMIRRMSPAAANRPLATALLVIGVLASLPQTSLAEGSILNALSRESELSMFYDKVTGASWISFLDNEGKVTVFAPTNDAIAAYGQAEFDRLADEPRKSWLRNFFTQVAILPNDLPNEQSSFAKGNPKLYFRLYKTDPSRFYVNEALVIRRSRSSSDSVLVYLIDTVPNFVQFENTQPSADEVLQNNSKIFSLRTYQLIGFRGRVNQLGLRDLFNSPTPSTFFVPIGSQQLAVVTMDIVEAHVIPGHVLFTPHFGDEQFQSASWPSGDQDDDSEEIEKSVSISLVNESTAAVGDHEPSRTAVATRSQAPYTLLVRTTIRGGNVRGASVLSRIAVANIPLSNGVLHLVETPLALITKSIFDYIKDQRESTNRFNMFFDIVRQSPHFIRDLQEGSVARTLFVPTNQAVSVLPNDVWVQYKSNGTELYKLLRYHLVPRHALTETAVAESGVVTQMSAAGVPLVLRRVRCTTGPCKADPGQNLRHQLIVECAGVNATVVSADIAATNGVLHLIDRVLGAASHSLGWKLQNEELLRTTRVVATKALWNRILDEPSSRLTFFAPDDAAWQKVKESYPTEYKRLVAMPAEAHRQAANIMERHLVDGELTLDDLLTTDRLFARTGDALVVHRNGDQLQLTWDGNVCRVVRSDLQAINGIIHIVDCVMMTRSDLIVSAATAGVLPTVAVAVACVFVTLAIAVVVSGAGVAY